MSKGLFLGIGLAIGAGAGWALSGLGGDGGLEGLEAELASARQERDEALEQLEASERDRDAARSAARRAKKRPGGAESVGNGPADAAPTAPTAEASAAPAAEETPADDAATRIRRVGELQDAVAKWFEAGDGDAALAGLKELAALVPEGREAAMALAVTMNQDVNGDGKLKLSYMTFYTALGDPAVKTLMGWALRNPSNDDFRVISAYSLPWTQSPDRTVEQFAAALGGEKNGDVQQALVWNLARMRKPAAEKALSDVFSDPNADPGLRARVATELATAEDPDIVAAIERAANDDPNLGVRAAAKASLLVRNPPATGYLVTGTVPDSQGEAAGMRAGDVVVSYGGSVITDGRALRQATSAATGEESVEVVVVRDGAEVTLMVRPGRMGVFGRAVKAQADK